VNSKQISSGVKERVECEGQTERTRKKKGEEREEDARKQEQEERVIA